MSILVLGGAGYIGSHTVDQLITSGYDVVIVDNLLTGHVKAVHKMARFYEGDIRDREFLKSVFSKEKIDGVIHFAASSLVGESMQQPLQYFDNNVYGMQVLLESMKEAQVKTLIFSSSAAVYGEVIEQPILETARTCPTNPYGESKLIMEKMIKWCEQAYGIRYVALRYFNVIGAKADASIGEDHEPETHLLPLILQVALGQRDYLSIYGDDYETADGTCIRDYVHVMDLAAAHVLALEHLLSGYTSEIFNLGSSNGFSVRALLEAAREVTGQEIPAKVVPRRVGDPAVLIASSEKATRILGWKPQYTALRSAIETAWQWHKQHPNGYEDDK